MREDTIRSDYEDDELRGAHIVSWAEGAKTVRLYFSLDRGLWECQRTEERVTRDSKMF